VNIAVAGGGIFGVTAALELRRRGHEVVLVDPQSAPNPQASSTDISKLIRMDYGSDHTYTSLMDRCFYGWWLWNQRWARALYHETGMLMLSSEHLRAGHFEGDSYAALRDHAACDLSRLKGSEIAKRFGWRGYVDGYLNPRAGWAESGEVVRVLTAEAVSCGVVLVKAAVTGLAGDRRVTGLRTPSTTIPADVVVVATGAWIPTLLPELGDRISVVGQPVLHFRVDPDSWGAQVFPPWAADIAKTGWYGFPARDNGIVKVANHGPGIPVEPGTSFGVPKGWEARCRSFLAAHLPALATAPMVASRLCLYADSFDGDFFIDRHPDRAGLVVSGAGSGHGFKFAPMLGILTADAVEGKPNPWLTRFRWRSEGPRKTEGARHG
jgi:sarcosine oxidase / L-pipecolate oxidase